MGVSIFGSVCHRGVRGTRRDEVWLDLHQFTRHFSAVLSMVWIFEAEHSFLDEKIRRGVGVKDDTGRQLRAGSRTGSMVTKVKFISPVNTIKEWTAIRGTARMLYIAAHLCAKCTVN